MSDHNDLLPPRQRKILELTNEIYRREAETLKVFDQLEMVMCEDIPHADGLIDPSRTPDSFAYSTFDGFPKRQMEFLLELLEEDQRRERKGEPCDCPIGVLMNEGCRCGGI